MHFESKTSSRAAKPKASPLKSSPNRGLSSRSKSVPNPAREFLICLGWLRLFRTILFGTRYHLDATPALPLTSRKNSGLR